MANEFKVKNGLIVSGSADFEQDLRVRGTLTVDELHTSITTSSVIFESGSTAFGNTFDDTHTLTGSVNITGSITLNGQAIGTGKLDETTFQTYTSSYKVATSDFNGLTSSYNSFTTSYISASSSFNTRIGSLESFSSSLDVSFVNETEFGAFSSSIKSFTSSINNYTTSLDSKLNTIDSTTGSLNTFTSSANDKLNLIESATASLYSFSSSVNNRLSTVETSTGSLNSFSSSTNTRLDAIETSTASLNSYSSSNDTRLGIIETSTSSLNSFTSSINTTIKNKLNADGVISGSSQILNGSNVVSSSTQVTNYGFAITGSNLFKGDQTHSGSIIPAVDNAYDLGSPTYQWRDVYISSGSLYIDGTKVISSTTQELQITTDNGQSIKILESGTDSIILQTADGDIELKSNADGDILLDPTNGKIMLKGAVEILNGQKIQSSVGGTPVVFANDIVVSGSIDITGTIEGIDLTAFSSSVNTRLGNLESAGTNLNSFTASANTRLGNLETESGSIRTTVNSYTSSTNNRLTSIETTTGSILSTNTTQDGRLTSIESKTGSYATTGSNIFQGNQTITGSLYVSQDLIIAGSSSIQHISSSVVNIADNIITVNAQNPSIRFGGLAVIDSGSSPQVSGSMLFDSTNDQWIFVHQNQTTVTSSVLLMGPQTFNNLGGEAFPTTNRILKSVNAEHVGDSNISDNGTTVTILSNTIINGTISATGTTLVSGSAQISFNGITDKPALVSGSSQVSFNGITDKPALVSGSAQISFNTIADKPTLVSGSSQVSYPSLSNIPSGIVSGSGQVDLTTTANYSSGIKSRLNAENVLSSSVQVVSALPAGTVSGSSQITFGSISSIPSGLVSGSSQITFGSISSIPSGLVSGSSQITFGSISSIPSGLVSGSAQLTAFVLKSGDTMTGALTISTSASPGLNISKDASADNRYLRLTNTQSSSKTWDLINQTNANNNEFVVYNHTDNLNAFRISTAGAGTFANSVTAAGMTSTAGLTVSGTAYYTFNKPSTTNYQTVALFGSTANGIFITSDSGIISRGAFFNGGWQATSTTGAYLNFNTSGGGMDLNVFSGATIGGSATFTSLFTVARDNFSFNGNAIYHAGNFTPANYLQLAGGTMTGAIVMSGTQQIRLAGFAGIEYYNGTSQWQGYIGTENNTGNLRYNSFNGTHTFYANGTQTMAVNASGQLSLSGSNSGSTPLVNLTATGTGTFQRGVRLLNSGMNAGDHIMMAVGQADGARNMGQFYFQYNGAGSTSNRISMGLHSVDDVFNILGSGNVGILNTAPSYTLHVGQNTAGNNVDYGLAISRHGNGASPGTYTTTPALLINEMSNAGPASVDTTGIFNMGFGRFSHTMTNAGNATLLHISYDGNLGPLRVDGRGNMWVGYDRAAVPTNSGTFGLLVRNGLNVGSSYQSTTPPTNGALIEGNVVIGSSTASRINFGTDGDGISLFRDNTYDLVLQQNAASGNPVYIAGAGNVVISIDSNNNETDRAFIVGSNAVKSSNALFSVNESGNGLFSGNLQVNNSALFYFNTSSAYALRLDSANSSTENDLRFAKGGTDYGAIQTNGSDHGFEFYVNTDGSSSGWQRMFYMTRNSNESVFDRGTVRPGANGTQNLGTSSFRWGTVFTSDLSLSNGIGDYTIVEGEEKLYLYNNKNNKVYSFVLQEEDPATATPKKS